MLEFRVVVEGADSETFDEMVERAYRTLPQKIRELPDFPGIQVVDEPAEGMLKKSNLPQGHQLLGLYSGVHRTQQRHDILRIAPDLIFVFRGPILRCLRGNLRDEVKRVVWHEVAHGLGHDEQQAKESGL